MAKKRKSDVARLDEVDRTMYTTFCSAANSLSQLYTQAQNQKKAAFQAGERHALEKMYQWIFKQHEEGSRVTGTDIVAYLQNEMDCGGEISTAPGSQISNYNLQPQMAFSNSSHLPNPGMTGQSLVHAGRQGPPDQHKNSVFSNALSSPVRRSLEPFQLAHVNAPQAGNGHRAVASDVVDQRGLFSGLHVSSQRPNTSSENHTVQVAQPHSHQIRETQSSNSTGSSMDMHEESPAHNSY